MNNFDLSLELVPYAAAMLSKKLQNNVKTALQSLIAVIEGMAKCCKYYVQRARRIIPCWCSCRS